MKTRERTVHFYDLLMKSTTRSDGITSPGCADLPLILARIAKAKPKGTEIVKRRSVLTELADWHHDAATSSYQLLINRADANVSDVAFRDLTSRSFRKAGKTKLEGIEASSHIIVRPNADRRTALVLMTMGAGVGSGVVERLINTLTRELERNAQNSDLFNFAHPSGERDARGIPVTYKVRYSFECVAHKDVVLDDALKSGEFVSMELIANKFEAFDQGGNLHIEKQSVEIKAGKPSLISGAGLVNAIRSRMRQQGAQQYEEARIRYKNATGADRVTTLRINQLDAAFTRKELIEFTTDVDAQQLTLSPTVISAMKALL